MELQVPAKSIKETLIEFGVTEDSISCSEKEALDRNGYVVLQNALDPRVLNQLREAFEASCAKNSGAVVIKESGTRHVNDLLNRDQVFEIVFTHPRLLAAVHHILRAEFRVGQIGLRDPLPGFGQQGLHADWTARSRGEPFRIATAIWLLDNFTPENGATRVVPGSHQMLGPPPKSFADPASRHPDQKIIVGAAGSVLVFNGHLWHSGTANKSAESRRAIQCVFVGRDEVRFSRIRVAKPELYRPASLYLLGYDPASRTEV